MNKTVVIIDDDNTDPIKFYEDALSISGFEVVRLTKFTSAVTFIERPDPIPIIWVIDVMMPIGEENLVLDGVEIATSTLCGLGAGLFLYRKLKACLPNSRAILFTSITTPDLLNEIERTLDDGDVCEAKLDLRPFDLVKLISTMTKETA